jgi:hypothetical protein
LSAGLLLLSAGAARAQAGADFPHAQLAAAGQKPGAGYLANDYCWYASAGNGQYYTSPSFCLRRIENPHGAGVAFNRLDPVNGAWTPTAAVVVENGVVVTGSSNGVLAYIGTSGTFLTHQSCGFVVEGQSCPQPSSGLGSSMVVGGGSSPVSGLSGEQFNSLPQETQRALLGIAQQQQGLGGTWSGPDCRFSTNGCD